ncbi:hypothetical protein B0T16DRAFT_158507 [Cercophora newfieldiana]|uniref:DUF7729 domain-containing protein n=1 Tax=Cercophora newfieldiana TaxID=92897 RepID=A0AA39Y599_9PEZI|nr:hypothetical protein B0T16DRAFT_158507 [Cercophora newfieldiana]
MMAPSWTSISVALAYLACHGLAATASSHGPTETLIIDTRVRYEDNGVWMMLSEEEVELRRLAKRQFDNPTQEPEPSVTTTFEIAVSTAPTAGTTTKPTTATTSPLPRPLDSNLSTNFTTSSDGSVPCPKFLNSFLTDERFKQCYPLSMLLQGSRSFFNAEKSLVSTTQVLDATCHSNFTYCNGYLSDLAKTLIQTENCGLDYQAGNPIVRNAHIALTAYAPVYNAGCLKDPQTSMYCYANAITNFSNPANVVVYYLPLNISLPGSAIPTCSSCLQQTMNVFQAATANRKQYLASNYKSAAQQINLMCGPSFVEEELAVEISSGAIRSHGVGSSWLMLATASALALLPLLL